MKKILLVALLSTMYLGLFAQSITIEGTVTDASDNTALPYVNIYLKGSTHGTYTDVKGNFSLTVPKSGGTLAFSFIGYEKKEIAITKTIRLDVKLKPLVVSLEESIVLPGENPADVIMRKVTEDRKKHDPEQLASFSFRTYNKFVVNINRDTDSAFFNNIDTLDSFEDTLVNKMNLFLMESITDKLYKKPRNYKETVLASRVSGLKNAQYVLLANEIQSFSFYKNYVQVLGKDYLSPIAEGNTRKYLFILQDTVDMAGERAYLIYYQPRKGKNFDGLTGLVYINTENFAVLKATAKAADNDGFTTQVVQTYTKMGEDSYFPTLFTADFTFAQVSIGVNDTTTKKQKNLTPVGKAKTTLYKIDLKPELKNKQFDNIELDYAPDALSKDNKFWDENRQDKLDSKDSLTYQIVDSIGKELNLDRRLEFLRIIQTGKWAVGPFNIHLDDIFRFNNFEGARPSLKVSTNDRLSRHFSVGGYYAYGFKDVHSKYGGNFTLFFNKSQSSWVDFLYSNDVVETGLQPMAQHKLSNEERWRSFYVNVMDRVERSKVTTSARLLRYITAEAGFETVNKKVTTPYRFGDGQQQYFKFTNAVVSLRWAPFEKLVRSFGTLRAKDSKWPVMYATFTKGFNNVFNGQFDFLRTDVMAEYDVRIRNVGRSYFKVNAGNVEGTVPYTEMYFGRAGFNNKNLTITTPWAFETMRYNEFFGNRYAALFFRHDFGSLLLKYKKFQPTFILVTNAYVSSLSNPNVHKNFTLNVANKGFFESGIQINDIYKINFGGYGVGVFYRYGPYSFDKPAKNLVFKLSITSALGF